MPVGETGADGDDLVGHAEATRSVVRRMRPRGPLRRFEPQPAEGVDPHGTRAARAAIIPSSPAFGVPALTMSGRQLRHHPTQRRDGPEIGERVDLTRDRDRKNLHALPLGDHVEVSPRRRGDGDLEPTRLHPRELPPEQVPRRHRVRHYVEQARAVGG